MDDLPHDRIVDLIRQSGQRLQLLERVLFVQFHERKLKLLRGTWLLESTIWTSWFEIRFMVLGVVNVGNRERLIENIRKKFAV